MPFVSRVTVDVDRNPGWRLRAIRAWHNLRALDTIHTLEVRVSSGRGLHFIGKSDELLTDEEIDTLRETLQDDHNRVDMDRVRGEPGHPRQVLWTDKGSRDNEADDDFEDIWEALDFIAAAEVDDYSYVHAIANYGHKGLLAGPGPDALHTKGL